MIWLVGARGMLGTEVAAALERSGLAYVGSDREVDILDPPALAVFAEGRRVSWIVNCAAYTEVDKAEDEEELATRLNAEGPANLSRLASRIGARMMHLSTDFVFDGKSARPYEEDHPVGPLSAYGRSKAIGEAFVREVCTQHVILRTAWLYGKAGGNFVTTMLRLMSTRDRIGVVADQRGSPTRAVDLAGAIAAICGAENHHFGTYHYANLGEASWYEFALEIERLALELGILARDCPVDPLTTEQYPAKAIRPAYSALSTSKIVEAYGLRIPGWRESLALFLKDARA